MRHLLNLIHRMAHPHRARLTAARQLAEQDAMAGDVRLGQVGATAKAMSDQLKTMTEYLKQRDGG